jgi:hypothetical protein
VLLYRKMVRAGVKDVVLSPWEVSSNALNTARLGGLGLCGVRFEISGSCCAHI